MLKKFKQLEKFFRPATNIEDLKLNPFVTIIKDHRLQIIPASQNDLAELLQLEQKVYHEQPWDARAFASELRKNDTIYLTVYEAEKLLALIGARFTPLEAHITNIMVDPAYQNMGIGHFLLDIIMDRAKANGCKVVSLEVRADNEKAQALYREYGFQPTFVRKDYYQNDHQDALNMVRDLRPDNRKRKKKKL